MRKLASEILLMLQVIGEALQLDWWAALILATFFSVGVFISLHQWYGAGVVICIPTIIYLFTLPDGREEA